ncbi:MAG TPA: peptidoglycan-binding protein [Spirochaetia bacterium]|nr:peptidoglycan-binding protein [Spirochaetia bacterium]
MLLFVFCVGLSSFLTADPPEVLFLKEPDRLHGPEVERLQRMLLYYGYDIGPDGVDGWFGTDTKKALIAYQKHMGLKQSGAIAVQDIETDLPWVPGFRLSELARPPQKAAKQRSVEIENGVSAQIRTYFGSFTLFSTEFDEQRDEYLLSPSGRFLVCRSYNPWAEGGTYSLFLHVWDFLTGKEFLVYGHQILQTVNSVSASDRETAVVEDFYWTAKEELYFTVSVNADAQTFGFLMNVR